MMPQYVQRSTFITPQRTPRIYTTPLLPHPSQLPPTPLPPKQTPHRRLPLPPPHPLHLPLQPLPHPPHQHLRILIIQILPLPLPKNRPAPRFHLRHVAVARYDVEVDVRDHLRGADTCVKS